MSSMMERTINRPSAFQTDAGFPLEQNDLILRPEAPSEGSTIFAASWSQAPQPQQPFQQGYAEYPLYPAVAVAGYPATSQSPQVVSYTANPIRGCRGGQQSFWLASARPWRWKKWESQGPLLMIGFSISGHSSLPQIARAFSVYCIFGVSGGL